MPRPRAARCSQLSPSLLHCPWSKGGHLFWEVMHLSTALQPRARGISKEYPLASRCRSVVFFMLQSSPWDQGQAKLRSNCPFAPSSSPPWPSLLFSREHYLSNPHAPKPQSQVLLLENPLKIIHFLIFLLLTATQIFLSL